MAHIMKKGTRLKNGLLVNSNTYHKGPLTFYNKHTFDSKTQIDHLKRKWEKGTLKGEYHLFIKRYTASQLTKMLQDAGFRISGVWGGYDSSRWTVTSPRTIILATKSWKAHTYFTLTQKINNFIRIWNKIFEPLSYLPDSERGWGQRWTICLKACSW